MEFPNARVKSVRADIGSGEITISFSLALNDDSLEAAKELAFYDDKDQGQVGVTVIPQQPALMLHGSTPTFSTVVSDKRAE
jgi:hypothetical protein